MFATTGLNASTNTVLNTIPLAIQIRYGKNAHFIRNARRDGQGKITIEFTGHKDVWVKSARTGWIMAHGNRQAILNGGAR